MTSLSFTSDGRAACRIGVDILWRGLTTETIQVVLDSQLLKAAADLAAKKQKVNRSPLIRQALRDHLKRLREQELEEQDRRGYTAQPQREEEFRVWEDAAVWPE